MAARAIIACVGAGRMGRGIAHAFAYAGHDVRLIDAKPRDATAREKLFGEARAEIRGTLAQIADLGGFDEAAHTTGTLPMLSSSALNSASTAGSVCGVGLTSISGTMKAG